MSTITKERIELFIKSPLENGLTRGEQMELARIALASLEAEPVGAFHIAEQQVDGTSDYIKDGEWPIDNGTIEVYAAPPVPVVPAALPENDDEDGQDIDYLEPSEVYSLGRTAGWNACRAAMLHGAEPVSQTYKLPVNTPCQDAPAHIWLQTAGVWPEDGELSELTWCSHNQHHDDTLYVRADLVNGNSPVTPDGWISCSDRMPEKYDFDIWVFSPSRGVLDGLQWDGSMFTDDEYQFVIHDATHWMRKAYPAAPQQEVNRG
ncbi:DUF551 domain-containing protein [Salmonella enterica subsp. enterica serovar Rubislaw]|nr:DUF551 domain-containing protein [Salmonella enterica]EEO2943449.1 DUF551 domain-containing protein [Salmonella enterica subsp. enterica serovar Rubislaw]EKQ6585746.1 DUF551 domain-containing protein [Escherichia coli]EEO4819067.1 DUF551 domain-containing protein [Salmonella enterica subsp. enterica serovar Rubislaw]EEO4855622.1 DUF551 domain-containing protein [Salmonella enterica subsp. enterica serovar Rubislaw]